MICAGKPDLDGWRAACRFTPCETGSATPRSLRRPPTSHGVKRANLTKLIDDKTIVKTPTLPPQSRKELAEIDFPFHDRRREAGSRWWEGGVPLHPVRAWLGHTSIAQTSTSLARCEAARR